jgi:hypothetical protein
MKIERIGFLKEIANDHEGIIYQNNYHNLREIVFAYYLKDHKDTLGAYEHQTTVAKFKITPKLP